VPSLETCKDIDERVTTFLDRPLTANGPIGGSTRAPNGDLVEPHGVDAAEAVNLKGSYRSITAT
jgi:hypothetical protein